MNVTLKYNIARAFKVIFYLLGFPLFILFVFRDSMPLLNGDYFGDKAMNSVKIAFAIWATVSLVQFGLYLAGTKQKLRVIVTASLVIVLMIVPMLIFDATAEKNFEKIKADAPAGVSVVDYDRQVQYFSTISDKGNYTDALNDNISKFVATYGLDGYYGKNYRNVTQLNTPAVNENNTVDYFKDGEAMEKAKREGKMIYNPNGLLYDGYIFGVREAVDLLLEYNEFKSSAVYIETPSGDFTKLDGEYVKYDAATHGTDATRYKKYTVDEALSIAVAAAESSPEWIEYSSTEQYIANEKAAAKYWITEDRLNEILNVVLKGPINTLIESLKKDSTLNLLLNAVPSLLPAIGDLFELVKADGAPVTLTGMIDIIYDGFLHGTLTGYKAETELDKYADGKAGATNLAKGLYGIGVYGDLDEKAAIARMIDPATDSAVTKAELRKGILNLLRNLSYYIHPENKVAWQFIDATDYKAENTGVDLQRYAWVKYHCEEFGRMAGCVLAPTDALLVGGTIGNGTPASQAYDVAALKQLKTDISYKADYYPYFAVRRYMFIFAGICALSIYFSSFCAAKEKEFLRQIYEGGNL